ncbi:hypothetical protein KY284_032267 [Solanum tuberosum]|nr:hypothetical protein KY284_032267 [Solanum tuberosum]
MNQVDQSWGEEIRGLPFAIGQTKLKRLKSMLAKWIQRRSGDKRLFPAANIPTLIKAEQSEDAHEFLQCFVNKLEYCCYNLEPQDNIVKEAFGGRFVSKLRCCNCDHFSVTHEPLIDISLEIEDIDNVPATLESFTKIEKIEFSCEKCKTQGPFEKQLIVNRAPSVVALHLKRLKNNEIVAQKVDKHVSFPLELDMLLYTNKINNEEMKYDLYAIIVHSRPSISSGYYYNFIRCAPNEWYKLMTSRAFVNLIIPTTSPCIPNNHAFDVGEFNNVVDEINMKHELNRIEEDDSPAYQEYSKDQLQDVKIKHVCSRDEEFMDALHGGSHVSFVNEKKRKLEDSPNKDY